MHDPMTVLCDIRFGWPKYSSVLKRWQMPTIATIWHVDPEKDGTDNSCDWFGHKRKLHPDEAAIVEKLWDLETLLDNRPHYPDSPEHKAFQPLKAAIYKLHDRRGWRVHPRWHIHHWRIQIHPVAHLKRWLFSRCATCGKRFPWGYVPVTTSWNGTGPRWFRSESNVFHHECRTDRVGQPGTT